MTTNGRNSARVSEANGKLSSGGIEFAKRSAGCEFLVEEGFIKGGVLGGRVSKKLQRKVRLAFDEQIRMELRDLGIIERSALRMLKRGVVSAEAVLRIPISVWI